MKISIIVPCFNEESCLQECFNQTLAQLKALESSGQLELGSKIVFIDDGSSDQTWEIIQTLPKEYAIGIKLSRNFGHQSALLAGLEFSAADEFDASISIDADLQHDISLIPDFVQEYKNGHEMVFGIKEVRSDSFLKNLTGSLFYRFMRLMNTKVIPNHADFRLMGLSSMKALLAHKEANLFLRGIVADMGFHRKNIYYKTKERFAGKSKYSFLKMLSLALNGVTSFSTIPLKIPSFFGVFFIFVSAIIILYVLFQYFSGNTVPGWTSTVLPIYFIGGVQLLFLGITGEYLGRIYMETKSRPRYIVDKIIK